MGERVCPWWLGYFPASPVRWLWQDPDVSRTYACTIRVVAVDIQPRMIAGLKRRVARAGLLPRVDARVITADSLGLADLWGKVDFALAMAVVHETPGPGWFFGQVAEAMKPGALLLLAEPTGHVKPPAFQAELDAAAAAGLVVAERPAISHRQTALLKKNGP